MGEKVSMSYKNWRGNEVAREVNQVIDARHFVGTPGYALLIVAGNTHLSVRDIERFLSSGGVGRSIGWIQRRRWLFQPPGTSNAGGGKPNADGRQDRAIQIMKENPTMSVRNLAKLLRQHRIVRSREWVRRHRCDHASDN